MILMAAGSQGAPAASSCGQAVKTLARGCLQFQLCHIPCCFHAVAVACAGSRHQAKETVPIPTSEWLCSSTKQASSRKLRRRRPANMERHQASLASKRHFTLASARNAGEAPSNHLLVKNVLLVNVPPAACDILRLELTVRPVRTRTSIRRAPQRLASAPRHGAMFAGRFPSHACLCGSWPEMLDRFPSNCSSAMLAQPGDAKHPDLVGPWIVEGLQGRHLHALPSRSQPNEESEVWNLFGFCTVKGRLHVRSI